MSPENYRLLRKLLKSVTKKVTITHQLLEKDPLNEKQEEKLSKLISKLEKSLNLIS